jgi:hypothetical protein
MNHPEHDLQRAIHRYLKLAVPHPRCIWAVDHARQATMLQRKRLIDRGCVSGIHDHFVLYGGRLITLEIKAGANGATEGQRLFAKSAMEAGASCFLVRSIDDVESALKACGIPIQATAQGRDQKLASWQAKPKKPTRRRVY